jgi:hypothetical protein
VHIKERTTLAELKTLVCEAMKLEIDQCFNAIKLFHIHNDANDDSFNELYSDDKLVLRDILQDKREIDLKMFTGSIMTKMKSRAGNVQIIFAKNKFVFQCETVNKDGEFYHLKAYRPECVDDISRWVC